MGMSPSEEQYANRLCQALEQIATQLVVVNRNLELVNDRLEVISAGV